MGVSPCFKIVSNETTGSITNCAECQNWLSGDRMWPGSCPANGRPPSDCLAPAPTRRASAVFHRGVDLHNGAEKTSRHAIRVGGLQLVSRHRGSGSPRIRWRCGVRGHYRAKRSRANSASPHGSPPPPLCRSRSDISPKTYWSTGEYPAGAPARRADEFGPREYGRANPPETSPFQLPLANCGAWPPKCEHRSGAAAPRPGE